MSVSPDSRKSGPAFHLPFLIGDAVLLLAAWGLAAQGHRPMTAYEVAAVAACVALGAWLGVWPFVLRHRAVMRELETTDLGDAVERIQHLDDVARQVSQATNKWQTAQDAAERTVRAAGELSERVIQEQAAFREFLEKANDAERNHLRLEVEKLRRNEGAWLQVLVFTLDHTFALFNAAARSRQQNVANQIGRFQGALLDAARRVGLNSIAVEPGAPFDADAHVLPDGVVAPPEGGVVAATLAPGYTFQGRLVRKPMVNLGGQAEGESTEGTDAGPGLDSTRFTTSPTDEDAEGGPRSEPGLSDAGGDSWPGDADASESPPSPS
ncbi:MAG: nucleotide exchange factor GrpE [Verrucomicrobiales bacterium]|nr:nucleotide exchange factor GrpE [Verrucomicrobiales bacterium]MCP5526050.1 nucleotide exchange factor GrpE [Verrucomicrobiales bacterium]